MTLILLILRKSTDSIKNVNGLISILSPISGIFPVTSSINPANESDSPLTSSNEPKSPFIILRKSISEVFPSKI